MSAADIALRVALRIGRRTVCLSWLVTASGSFMSVLPADAAPAADALRRGAARILTDGELRDERESQSPGASDAERLARLGERVIDPPRAMPLQPHAAATARPKADRRTAARLRVRGAGRTGGRAGVAPSPRAALRGPVRFVVHCCVLSADSLARARTHARARARAACAQACAHACMHARRWRSKHKHKRGGGGGGGLFHGFALPL